MIVWILEESLWFDKGRCSFWLPCLVPQVTSLMGPLASRWWTCWSSPPTTWRWSSSFLTCSSSWRTWPPQTPSRSTTPMEKVEILGIHFHHIRVRFQSLGFVMYNDCAHRCHLQERLPKSHGEPQTLHPVRDRVPALLRWDGRERALRLRGVCWTLPWASQGELSGFLLEKMFYFILLEQVDQSVGETSCHSPKTH